MSGMSNNQRDLHILFLSKYGPQSNPQGDKSLMAFGFYDEVCEDFHPDINYQDAFALRYPMPFTAKHLSAKQLFTLQELQMPKTENSRRYGQRILLNEQEEFLPFLGAIFLAFDLKSNSDIDLHFKNFINNFGLYLQQENARQNGSQIQKGSLSKDAILRVFKCPNCADLCVTVNTAQLQDVFLLSKIVQHCTSIHVQNQFSALWSFAALSFTIQTPEQIERLINCNPDIAVDFRISFGDEATEKNFLKNVPTTSQAISRVGGVLGTGNYSVHLPFNEYMILFDHKRNNGQATGSVLSSSSALLRFLCENDFEISNRRVRFCYQADLFNGPLGTPLNPPSPYNSAIATSSPTGSHLGIDLVESMIYSLRNKLTKYRNILKNYEYNFRESLALVKDLVYTFNDIFYRKDIHSYIFSTQVLSLLRGIDRYLNEIVTLQESSFSEDTILKAIYYVEGQIKVYTAELIDCINKAVISISDYNRSLITVSRNTINGQNYGMQSRINIEKFLVAYSMFLQQICDDYTNGKQRNVHTDGEQHKEPKRYLLPYLYIDIRIDQITRRTIFRRFRQQAGKVPVLLPVACPNYRRFSNIYRLLPLLVHEIAHEFRYLPRKDRNLFLLREGMGEIASVITEDLCTKIYRATTVLPTVTQKISCHIKEALFENLQTSLDNFDLLVQDTKLEDLESRIIIPYLEQNFSVKGASLYEVHAILRSTAAEAFDNLVALADLQPLSVKRIDVKIRLMKQRVDIIELAVSFITFFLQDPPDNKEVFKRECTEWQAVFDIWKTAVDEATNSQESSFIEDYDATVLQMMQRALEQMIQSIDSSKPVFYESSFFRIIAVTLLQTATTNLLNQFLWLEDEWGGDAFLYKNLDSLKEKEERCNAISNFWSFWNELILNPDSKNLEKNLDALYYYGSQILDSSLGDSLKESFSFLHAEDRDLYAQSLLNTVIGKIQEQHEVYNGFFSLFHMAPIVRFVGENERQVLNHIADHLSTWATKYCHIPYHRTASSQNLLNQLTSKESILPVLEQVLDSRDAVQWAGIWRNYGNVYNEVCADLGMCYAFGFTPIGYLTFVANQYIQSIDDIRGGDTSFNFRDARYQQVTDILILVHSSDFGKSHAELIEQIHQIFLRGIEQIRSSLLVQIDLPVSLNFFAQKVQEIQHELDHASHPKGGSDILRTTYTSAKYLEELLNKLSLQLRLCSADIPAGSEPSIEQNLREKIDILKDCLRYLRVVLHLCRAISHTVITTNETCLSPREQDHFKKICFCLRKEEWILNLKSENHPWVQGSENFFQKIGNYYNNWGKTFTSSYDLREQLDFVFQYYSKANQRYHDLMELSLGKDPITSEQFANVWFDTFYPEKPLQGGKE